MRVGFLQCNVVHNREENICRVRDCLSKQDCDLLVLSELSVCGYLFPDRKALYECAEEIPTGGATCQMIALSKEYDCTIIFGIAEKENEKIYNTAVIVSKGKYIGKYRKIHLSDFEKTLFERGNENQIFELDGLKIGVQICFDLRFPEISREQIRMGAEMLCVLANFGAETTYRISAVRAIENLTPLVLCNRIGEEFIPGMEADFLGKSTIVDGSGRPLCLAPEKEESVEICDVNVPQEKSNRICRNFGDEIAFHYQAVGK